MFNYIKKFTLEVLLEVIDNKKKYVLEELISEITEDNRHPDAWEGNVTKNTTTKETVDHPNHYNSGKLGIEVIDIIKNSLNDEGYEGFLIGNVLKYITRYKLKNGAEDLKKAQWYLNEVLKIYNEKN